MIQIYDENIKALNIESALKIKWIDDCLRLKGTFDLPPKISMKKYGGIFYNVMPTIMEPFHIAGLKCVNRYPDRVPTLNSEILLYNYDSGKLKAIMDGNEITTQRTAAVAVHSIQLLAVKNFKTITLVGLGEIMYATSKILFDTYADKKLDIVLLKHNNHEVEFVENFKHYNNLNFIFADTMQEAVKNADIVISAVTYIENDFCESKYYKEGCTVVPIHTRGFMQCDLDFDKVFGDDKSHIQGFKYFNQFKSFNEVTDVLLGNTTGRDNDKQRILVYNIGIAIHDIYFANKIVELIESINN